MCFYRARLMQHDLSTLRICHTTKSIVSERNHDEWMSRMSIL